MRSFTCMPRMLQVDIPHNFQCTNIREASGWFRFVADKGARSLTELDCKKPFDNINPKDVMQAFTEASAWLYKRRRQRHINLHWSVNKDSPKLDRAGQANHSTFWCLPHDLLTRLLRFELLHNNVLHAVGGLWRRSTGIPMGRPFSAQSADLHTLWRVKKAGKRLRDWRSL